jgi:predicted anti-sigma-YlaC factor YlaD
MDNHPREEALALYSTGDLESNQLRSVTEHLADCELCRNCVAQFEQIEGLLARVTAEPPAKELQEVRQRVMAALHKNRRRRLYFEWAAAAAAIAVTALLLPHKHSVPVKPHTVAVANVPAPRAVQAQEVPVVRHTPRRRRSAGLRSIALITRPGEAPSIKITTADPSVVILLPPETRQIERTDSDDD